MRSRASRGRIPKRGLGTTGLEAKRRFAGTHSQAALGNDRGQALGNDTALAGLGGRESVAGFLQGWSVPVGDAIPDRRGDRRGSGAGSVGRGLVGAEDAGAFAFYFYCCAG